MIHYEYPFNERLRTMLRLEDLFERFDFFAAQTEPFQHHVALTTLFEIVDVAGRADFKSDLLKELDRQKGALAPLFDNPNIDQSALHVLLNQIEVAHQDLSNMHGKTGQHLAENEWLTSIRSRSIIPGGTCEFDLPSYYAWQHLPIEQRQHDIEQWAIPLFPLRNGTRIVLRLLRESGSSSKVIASGGSYQQMLSGRTYQLMQVHIDDIRLIPEISANKYMLWVRFAVQDGDGKPKPVDYDVPFLLTLCNF